MENYFTIKNTFMKHIKDLLKVFYIISKIKIENLKITITAPIAKKH